MKIRLREKTGERLPLRHFVVATWLHFSLFLTLLVFASTTANAGAVFEAVEGVSGGNVWGRSIPTSISADGSTVVGWVVSNGPVVTEARIFRWSSGNDGVEIVDGIWGIEGPVISGDGEVISGFREGDIDKTGGPFWLENGVSLRIPPPVLPGASPWSPQAVLGAGDFRPEVRSISADGSRIVGGVPFNGVDYLGHPHCRDYGFVADNGNVQALSEMLGQEGRRFDVLDVSAAGDVILASEFIDGDPILFPPAGGYDLCFQSRVSETFLLKDDVKTVIWSTPPGSHIDRSMPRLVSGDGKVVVGEDWPVVTRLKDGVWTTLEPAPGALACSMGGAGDVSHDGNVIVGASWPFTYSNLRLYQLRACIWDEANGSRDLQLWLEERYGLVLPGWSFQAATAISSDGLTIAGVGINPSGEHQAFRVVLSADSPSPVPGLTGFWLVLAALALAGTGLRLHKPIEV
jgi:hypothetical protein